MSKDNAGRENELPEVEDYSSPQSSSDLDAISDDMSMGTMKSAPDSVDREGEQFGEYAESGTGTDLTAEMMNTDARSGLVKGGQRGAADAAGLAQYGGETGQVTEGDAEGR